MLAPWWRLCGRCRSKAAHEFRRSSAQTVCRVLGGDLTLVAEIEARHDSLQQADSGRAVQEFLSYGDDTEHSAKRFKGNLPVELQVASAERRSAYYNLWLQDRQQQLEERRMRVRQQMQQQELAFAQSGYELLTGLSMADARDKIALGDVVRRILQKEGRF